MRPTHLHRLALLGALVCGAMAMPLAGAQSRLPPAATVSPADLRPHLEALAGVRHPEADPKGLARAADYIEGRLKAYGLSVRRQSFGAGITAGVNIIGRLEGSVASRQLVVVGAHYDTTDSTPGADDNASGVAALLELARRLPGLPRRHAVEVVAFSLEEQGFLGSSVYVRSVRPRATVSAAFILESVGYTCHTPGCQRFPAGFQPGLAGGARVASPEEQKGDFVALVADAPAGRLAARGAELARGLALPALPLVLADKGARLPAARLSDHVPFWDADLPALQLTGTAFLRNPGYHRPTDKVATLDLEFLAKVATLTTRLVAASAGE